MDSKNSSKSLVKKGEKSSINLKKSQKKKKRTKKKAEKIDGKSISPEGDQVETSDHVAESESDEKISRPSVASARSTSSTATSAKPLKHDDIIVHMKNGLLVKQLRAPSSAGSDRSSPKAIAIGTNKTKHSQTATLIGSERTKRTQASGSIESDQNKQMIQTDSKSHYKAGKSKGAYRKNSTDRQLSQTSSAGINPSNVAINNCNPNNQSGPLCIKVKAKTDRGGHSQTMTRQTNNSHNTMPPIIHQESLRWEYQLEDSDAEEERLRMYKVQRRKRYLAAANKSYSEWLASPSSTSVVSNGSHESREPYGHASFGHSKTEGTGLLRESAKTPAHVTRKEIFHDFVDTRHTHPVLNGTGKEIMLAC